VKFKWKFYRQRNYKKFLIIFSCILEKELFCNRFNPVSTLLFYLRLLSLSLSHFLTLLLSPSFSLSQSVSLFFQALCHTHSPFSKFPKVVIKIYQFKDLFISLWRRKSKAIFLDFMVHYDILIILKSLNFEISWKLTQIL